MGLVVAIAQCGKSNETSTTADVALDAAAVPKKLFETKTLLGKDLLKAADGKIADMLAKEASLSEQKSSEPLLVNSWNWSTEYGYAIVEGKVKNVSSDSIDNVVAVAEFSDRSGNLIKSDDALIDFRPLLPGQTSPFKVMASENPAMKTAALRFRTFAGQELGYSQKSKAVSHSSLVQSSRVTEIQGNLKALNYITSEPDGVLGRGTLAALKEFQKDYGLPISSKVSPQIVAATGVAVGRDPVKKR